MTVTLPGTLKHFSTSKMVSIFWLAMWSNRDIVLKERDIAVDYSN